MGEYSLGPQDRSTSHSGPWYSEMTRYHWFVLIVAALGWLFDCLDQQLFTLARPMAMKELLNVPAGDPQIGRWSGFATTIFMLGWATGGLFFGALGDKIGRAKTMMITILLYSGCTGLSSLSRNVYDFSVYRFLTGLGVGGEFAVGVALVAEVMPASARARALSLLQALSAVGNISAALIGWGLAPLEKQGISPWRVMFIVGALPALLALIIRRRLKEPERWQGAQADAGAVQKRGSYVALFSDPRWRHSAVVGLFLAIPGVVGLWGIGFFSGDLTREVFRQRVAAEKYQVAITAAQAAGDNERLAVLEKLQAKTVKPAAPAAPAPAPANAAAPAPAAPAGSATAGQPPAASSPGEPPSELETTVSKQLDAEISSELTFWQSMTMLTLQFGAFTGMYSFGWFAQRVGRKPTFAVAYVAAMLTTILVFWKFNGPADLWMIFLMGIFQLSLFAGYAIYFPEIFPTYLRSTGTSFCYNVGRYVAAFGPTIFGLLTANVFVVAKYPAPLNWRYAGMTMSAVFLIGLVTLLWARETKDQPLPD